MHDTGRIYRTGLHTLTHTLVEGSLCIMALVICPLGSIRSITEPEAGKVSKLGLIAIVVMGRAERAMASCRFRTLLLDNVEVWRHCGSGTNTTPSVLSVLVAIEMNRREGL